MTTTATLPRNGKQTAPPSTDYQKVFDLFGCRVLLRRLTPSKGFNGGPILMPDTAIKEHTKELKRAVVLALGPGQLDSTEKAFLPLAPVADSDGKPTSRLKVGDEVIIADFGFTELPWPGEEMPLIIISAEDIKGVIRK
jgi:co-chaperonin GroES (HSP10)